MTVDITTAIIQLLSILIVVGGIIFLQIFLCKKDNKWLGLVLPGLTLLGSILAVLNVPTSSITSLSLNGEIIQKTVQHNEIGDAVLQMVTIFLTFNLATAILLVIYARYRKKRLNYVA
jgi:hypothetical protein